MYAVMRSDFLNGLLLLDRLQRDACFHFRAEGPPLPRFHFCSLSETAILYLNEWSEFWGALQTTSFGRAQIHCHLYTVDSGNYVLSAMSNGCTEASHEYRIIASLKNHPPSSRS